MILYDSRSEAVQDYVKRVTKEAKTLSKENQDILEEILSTFKMTKLDEGDSWDKRYDKLKNRLWTENTNDLTSIFTGDQFLVLEVLFGNEWAKKLKKVWDRCYLYPYYRVIARRPYRMSSTEDVYLDKAILDKLNEMIDLVIHNFSYEGYFSNNAEDIFRQNEVIPDLIALEIDEGNDQILEALDHIIHGENCAGVITREMIKGMLMSHDQRVHQWVGDLLLAARLQEGLRKTIVDVMDGGSKEGFLFLLKLILDHDLIRFPAIVRSFALWTGLGLAKEKPQTIKKAIEAGYKALTDNNYLEEALESNDSLIIYMALWAVAFKDITKVEERLKKLLTDHAQYKKLVALYFLKQSEFPLMQHRLAKLLLDDADLEVKCWVISNLFDCLYDDQREELHYGSEGLFDKLKAMLDELPKKALTFNESVFPWQKAQLNADKVIEKMLFTIQEEMMKDIKAAQMHIEAMADYMDKMSVDSKEKFISAFLEEPKTAKQKIALIKLMGDKSAQIRSKVSAIVESLVLSEEDYQMLEEFLTAKQGDLRKNVISVLLNQKPDDLLKTIRRLAEDKNENKRLAAIDMGSFIEEKKAFKGIVKECKEIISFTEDTPQKTKKLSKNLKDTKEPDYTPENGFGLYDPSKKVALKKIACDKDFSYDDILCSSLEDMEKILFSFGSIFEKHKDFEYEISGSSGEVEKVVLGEQIWIRPIRRHKDGKRSIDDYPLAELWKKEAKKLNLTASKILEIMFYSSTFKRAKEGEAWYDEVMKPFLKVNRQNFMDMIDKVPFYSLVYDILGIFLEGFEKKERFWISSNMSCSLYYAILKTKDDKSFLRKKGIDSNEFSSYMCDLLINGAQPIAFWHYEMKISIYDDQSFSEFFNIEYVYYQEADYRVSISLKALDFERAFNLGLIDENELYLELCQRPLSEENLYQLTNYEDEAASKCNKFKEIANKVAERIIIIEAKRGDMGTKVSHLAARIQRCESIHSFAALVTALEKENYVRGYNLVNKDSTKQEILSHLLKCCYPKQGDDENILRELLKDEKVSEKSLINAAMYAPWWLGIIEKYLGWAGLKMVGWYFHAHMNEDFSDEKAAMVARFSPIEVEDFKNGAFDIDWFHEAYNTLGKERFDLVYDSAKYIAAGSLHKRSQLFADAVLGKLDCKKAEETITSKRNKDYVLCYGLIPLNNDKKEMLRRYEFLHGFIKESSKFGAQRRASEQQAGTMGLYNLARNAGFSDIHRFTWYMETEKMQEIRTYLQPTAIQDVMVMLCTFENGDVKIKGIKDGKELKSLPASLKKVDAIKEMQEIQKSLKNQYVRARSLLEKAMESEEEFSMDELTNLSLNPVIEPLLRNLVFISEDKHGYFKEAALVDASGKAFKLQSDEKLMIAHPLHLYKMSIWAEYQKDIFDRGIVQPFKQVFRELYRPNADELKDKLISYRYAGHQIQPNKAMALLKTRGWVHNGYQSFQKMYYKQNVAAKLISRLDWLRWADGEAPTIECVTFEERKTGVTLEFKDIPECLFSEVMRDIDLVVSVAHVGGVNIEASLSTIEMRKAVLTEMLRLLKLTNVTLKDAHAFIKGKYGEYTVHLGSGTVHKMLVGAIHILAIHSGHRGRIFLPFMDEDPRTAEIISKIVFLAEDKKIKDPIILEQIKS